MFAELQLSGELRLKLAGAVLTGACIDQSDMSIALRLTTRAELGEDPALEYPIGGVISINAGPNVVGLIYYMA